MDNLADPIMSSTDGNSCIIAKRGYCATPSEQVGGWESEVSQQQWMEARQQEDKNIASSMMEEEDRRLAL
jgi:hypothetical protein